MKAARCTGLTASWCPIHGDCTCPRDENGATLDMNRPDCPLHGTESTHATPTGEQLALGAAVAQAGTGLRACVGWGSRS